MTQKINRRFVLVGMAMTSIIAATGPAFAKTAQQILAQTDRMRIPQQAFRATIKITEYKSGRKGDSMALTVYSKPRPSDGQFRSLVHIDAPRRDQGKLMLRDGKELYFYDPDASNTIRISPQQRLLGQASNGDVMTTNFARDYAATLAGVETIKDNKKKQRRCYALKQKAKTSAAVYGRIEYWVDEKTSHPVKGKFYSRSGKLLKIAFYGNFRKMLGGLRPAKVMIIDGLNKSNVTVMDFSNFKAAKLPDVWFQKSYLPKFQKAVATVVAL